LEQLGNHQSMLIKTIASIVKHMNIIEELGAGYTNSNKQEVIWIKPKIVFEDMLDESLINEDVYYTFKLPEESDLLSNTDIIEYSSSTVSEFIRKYIKGGRKIVNRENNEW